MKFHLSFALNIRGLQVVCTLYQLANCTHSEWRDNSSETRFYVCHAYSNMFNVAFKSLMNKIPYMRQFLRQFNFRLFMDTVMSQNIQHTGIISGILCYKILLKSTKIDWRKTLNIFPLLTNVQTCRVNAMFSIIELKMII